MSAETETGGLEVRGAVRQLGLWADQNPRGVHEILLDGPGGTGKSSGIAGFLLSLGTIYPGIRVLMVRKTRASLSESFLVTWERVVAEVCPNHPMLDGGTPEHRSHYELLNGTHYALGGLDKPSKLYSTDWDVVFVNEAFELTLDEWQQFRRGLRNYAGGIPFQLLLGDTNPREPRHWLNLRCNNGDCRRLLSRHEDNPSLYDREGEITQKGSDYIASLDRLTGVLYSRLRLGQWVAAEGVVWETYDEAIHHIQRPEGRLQDVLGVEFFVAGQDWGSTHAGCLSVYGVAPNGAAAYAQTQYGAAASGPVLFRVAEVYRTGETIEQWAEWMLALHGEFGFQFLTADPSRPDAIKRYNEVLGQMDYPESVRTAQGADNQKTYKGKGDFGGLDRVRQWFKDGRIFFLRDSLRFGRDDALAARGLPWETTQEIPAYVYLTVDENKRDEEHTDPRCKDEGCDVLRYVVNLIASHDFAPEKVGPLYAPWTLGSVLEHEGVLERSKDWYPGRT